MFYDRVQPIGMVHRAIAGTACNDSALHQLDHHDTRIQLKITMSDLI